MPFALSSPLLWALIVALLAVVVLGLQLLRVTN
jgi:hypothetical protein